MVMCAEQRHRCLWIERVLLGTGIVCLGWWGVVSLQATRYQSQQRDALAQMRVAAPAVVNVSAALPTGSLIGALEIPRLGLSAIIAEGDDDATLKVAIGHLPDTALPWHEGNSALAGHRNTFFWPLQHIRVGDELRVSTVHGDFRYQVREMKVVGPNDLWVLDPTDRPTLTLITCYPFRYVGKAPRRFIVRAERATGVQTTRSKFSEQNEAQQP
jgi:sortase A